MSKLRKIEISYQEFQNINELSQEDNDLIKEAKKAMQKAYAPYSEFNVGCALLFEDGSVVHGANQENSAYPAGLCAERVALFQAGVIKKDVGIKKLAISTEKEINGRPIAPCGSCRQVMIESISRQNESFEILLYSGKSVLKFENALDLMPLNFGPDDLK